MNLSALNDDVLLYRVSS